jgi:hypothetical protein
MSVATLARALPRACRWAFVPVALAVAVSTPAQERPGAGAPGEDPAVVVTPTVQPRIAYRGVPREQNPVHAQSTVFPGRVFHDTLDGVLGRLVGDDALGQTGSAGVLQPRDLEALTGAGGVLDARAGQVHSSTAATAGPVSSIGAAGGAIGGATGTIGRVTGGLGATITGALGVMPGLAPAGADNGAGR